jgi:hypothetical protein
MPCICLLLAPLGLLQLPGVGVLKGARLRVWWSGFHHVAVVYFPRGIYFICAVQSPSAGVPRIQFVHT